MSVAEQRYRHDEPELKPALSLVEDSPEQAKPSHISPSNQEMRLEAIAIALEERILPIEIFEGVESEDEMILRVVKFNFISSLPLSDPTIRNSQLDYLQIRLSANSLTGDAFVDLIRSSGKYAGLSGKDIKSHAEKRGFGDILLSERAHEISVSRPVSTERWREIIDRTRQLRRAEQRQDAITVGRDFYIITGEMPSGDYLLALQNTDRFPSYTKFKELFNEEDFEEQVRIAIIQFEEEAEDRQKARNELLAEMEKATLPPKLFIINNKGVISQEQKLERYAKYLIAEKFIKPESSEDIPTVEEQRIDVCTRDYTIPGAKSFYRRVMNLNFIKAIDGQKSDISSVTRAEIQTHAAMLGVLDYIDPFIYEENKKVLNGIKERVNKKIAKNQLASAGTTN